MDVFAGIAEPVFRLGAFVGVFAAMALLELALPRRELNAAKSRRWLTNGAIVGIDSVVVRLMSVFFIPIAAVAAAIYAEGLGIGLFNWTSLPSWFEIAAAIVIFDLAIWFQHWAFHKVPLLWRLHRVHHADIDMDVTTGLRFHPIEVALSMLYKVALVFVLGPAALAVVLFEVFLNGTAMFNHANVNLPRPLDRLLRLALVTPDMHRVHHSIMKREHNSNFGFNLSVWDRLLGTYTDQPEQGHLAMTIGLAPYQNDNPTRLGWSLALPMQELPKEPAQGRDTGTAEKT